MKQDQQFEQWVRDHGTILHHVANGFAEGADRQDLMQELMLAVWKSIPSFRAEAQPSTYIYRVAHHAALTWKRRERNYQRRVEQSESLVAQDGPDASTRLLEKVYAEIRQLPPLDRSLMLLSLDGLGYSEMAGIHGLTESNVGARLSRARQKLTHALKGAPHEL